MGRKRAKFIFYTILLFGMIALWGCGKMTPPESESVLPQPLPVEELPPVDHTESSHPDAGTHKDNTTNPASPPLEISSSPDKPEPGNNAPTDKEDVAKPDGGDNQGTQSDRSSVDSNDPVEPIIHYTATQPRLMGFQIQDNKQLVRQKIGEPKHKYVMGDETDPIMVYQYDGFMIGFDTMDAIKFIHVTKSDIDPGLNGVRLADSKQKAMQLLGTPAVSNDYVITYQNKEAILKLDIDPETETILSIKLFPSE